MKMDALHMFVNRFNSWTNAILFFYFQRQNQIFKMNIEKKIVEKVTRNFLDRIRSLQKQRQYYCTKTWRVPLHEEFQTQKHLKKLS